MLLCSGLGFGLLGSCGDGGRSWRKFWYGGIWILEDELAEGAAVVESLQDRVGIARKVG